MQINNKIRIADVLIFDLNNPLKYNKVRKTCVAQAMSLLEVCLYFCCRGTRNVKAKNNAAPGFSFWFLLFCFFFS